MAIIAREPESKFTPAPEGLHAAVCCDVVDLGLLDDGYGMKHKVEIWWQLDFVNADTDKRFLVRRRYTNSLSEKANLRKDLEVWRGRKFTPIELQGFDLEKLIGVCAQVQVVHRITDEGKTFANVQAVVPLGKGMPKVHVGDAYVRVQDRTPTPAHADAPAAHDEDDDAVPF